MDRRILDDNDNLRYKAFRDPLGRIVIWSDSLYFFLQDIEYGAFKTRDGSKLYYLHNAAFKNDVIGAIQLK